LNNSHLNVGTIIINVMVKFNKARVISVVVFFAIIGGIYWLLKFGKEKFTNVASSVPVPNDDEGLGPDDEGIFLDPKQTLPDVEADDQVGGTDDNGDGIDLVFGEMITGEDEADGPDDEGDGIEVPDESRSLLR
jgi:hypothetical protein